MLKVTQLVNSKALTLKLVLYQKKKEARLGREDATQPFRQHALKVKSVLPWEFREEGKYPLTMPSWGDQRPLPGRVRHQYPASASLPT